MRSDFCQIKTQNIIFILQLFSVKKILFSFLGDALAEAGAVNRPKAQNVMTSRGKATSKSPKPAKSFLRPTRNIHTIIRAHRKLRTTRQHRQRGAVAANGDIKRRRQSIGSALATRKRLAKTLFVLAVLFFICWTPYSICLVICSLNFKRWTLLAVQISLIFANSHAALSPLIYCIMTRSYANQGLGTIRCRRRDEYMYGSSPSNQDNRCCASCCCCFVCICCCCCSRRQGRHQPPRNGVSCFCCFLQRVGGAPSTNPWGHNSSTNEENLGPFHPRYIKPRVMGAPVSRCTSHYFH